MRDGFDVMSLRKHIKCGEGVKSIAVGSQRAQVAREGGGVAGDIGDARGAQREDAYDSFGFGPGAGRVEEDEVNGRETCGVSREPCADARRFDGSVRELRVCEIETGERGGRRVAFDADDAREAARERQRE